MWPVGGVGSAGWLLLRTGEQKVDCTGLRQGPCMAVGGELSCGRQVEVPSCLSTGRGLLTGRQPSAKSKTTEGRQWKLPVEVKVFARNWHSVPSAILHQSKRSHYARLGSRGWRKKQRRDQCRRVGGTTELIFRKYPLPPAQVPATVPFFDCLRLSHLFFQSSLQ